MAPAPRVPPATLRLNGNMWHFETKETWEQGEEWRVGEMERWRRERRSGVERSGEKRRGKRMEKVKGSWKVEGGRRRRRRGEKRKVRVV